jgi:ABC-type glycerol-3-phosphate transport system substrate-binding protein
VSFLDNFNGKSRVIRTEEEGFVEYRFNLPQAGGYNIEFTYYPVPGRAVDIERAVLINGELPFSGASYLVFPRLWADAGPVTTDGQGNELRPSQIEKPQWETLCLEDDQGYTTEPYCFYFKAGENTLRISGVSEAMAISAIRLVPPQVNKPYTDYLAGFNLNQYQNTDRTWMELIQGEASVLRNSPSLYAVSDHSSAVTQPESTSIIYLNMVGGENWKIAGQWIEWDFEVPENGLYRISLSARQNTNQGLASSRSLLIDGEIPCEEAAFVSVPYGNEWHLVSPVDSEGNELLFPLEKGAHKLRIEVTLGPMGGILSQISSAVTRLNSIYRQILVLTGASPDPYRDYQIDLYYPEAVSAMFAESRALYKLGDDLVAFTGESSATSATIFTFAKLLEDLSARPDQIPAMFKKLKTNISSLSEYLATLSSSQLGIDFIAISAPDAELPSVRQNFFQGLAHELKMFAGSFVTDYSNMGTVYKDDSSVIDVWQISGTTIGGTTIGRDQSTILKQLIDNQFTPSTGIKVNLRLTNSSVLMATVAGIGPDVALGQNSADPVNYALRDAMADLTQFPDFQEVASRFAPSALVPYRYNGGVYALPETQEFNILFFRTDILSELGLEPPQSWQDIINMLPVLQKNNLEVGIPADYGTFYTFLYQHGGTVYTEKGDKTLIDSEAAVAAFSQYTQFFTNYESPKSFNLANRFRTGEMPVAIGGFTNFNTLEVFAPEIRGLWDFSILPGNKEEDGSINHAVNQNGAASVLFKNAKNREGGWEFLKWWLSTDTQLQYARELESIMGASARYATSNLEAFNNIAWSSKQLRVLNEQRTWSMGTPEVPGSYYVGRLVGFAINAVLNNKVDPRETLLDYTQQINDELLKKRKEFGLE